MGRAANTGVNALRISSNTHILKLRGMRGGMPLCFVLTVSMELQIQYSSLVMLRDLMLTAALHLSNKVTVYLSDHRSRASERWYPERCADKIRIPMHYINIFESLDY